MDYTVKQIADLSGVSQRTLRYYDEIGLLSPSKRTAAGYRVYGAEQLERLQQILLLRELNFSLQRIGEILCSEDYERREALELQAQLLQSKARHYERLAQMARDQALGKKGKGKMNQEKLLEAFDYKKQDPHAAEAQARYGESYQTSQQRLSSYGEAKKEMIAALQRENLQRICENFEAGVPAEDSAVQLAVAQAHKMIDRYFYPCSLEVWSCLGKMYVGDERFKKFYDDICPGLAQYYSDAIEHYCIVNTEESSAAFSEGKE